MDAQYKVTCFAGAVYDATYFFELFMAVWRSGSALVLINEINLLQARLVLGWVTVSRFNSLGQHFTSICHQPPRSTQPSVLCGTVK